MTTLSSASFLGSRVEKDYSVHVVDLRESDFLKQWELTMSGKEERQRCHLGLQPTMG
jgi:hypothetical protein